MKKNDGIEKENNINGKNTKQTNICENKMYEIDKKNKKNINKRFKMLSKKRKRNETNKNKKEGYGEFEWDGGKKYKGYWKNGKQHGEGMLYNIKNKSWRKGIWDNGKRIKWIKE